MKVQVTTNNHDRQFLFGYEVPEEVKAEYDWLDDDSKHDNWIKFKGHHYHVADFMAVNNIVHNPNPPEWQEGWDGYRSDSFFSGVVIKISDDNETYRIGTFIGSSKC